MKLFNHAIDVSEACSLEREQGLFSPHRIVIGVAEAKIIGDRRSSLCSLIDFNIGS